jgi:hypothetical protein
MVPELYLAKFDGGLSTCSNISGECNEQYHRRRHSILLRLSVCLVVLGLPVLFLVAERPIHYCIPSFVPCKLLVQSAAANSKKVMNVLMLQELCEQYDWEHKISDLGRKGKDMQIALLIIKWTLVVLPSWHLNFLLSFLLLRFFIRVTKKLNKCEPKNFYSQGNLKQNEPNEPRSQLSCGMHNHFFTHESHRS